MSQLDPAPSVADAANTVHEEHNFEEQEKDDDDEDGRDDDDNAGPMPLGNLDVEIASYKEALPLVEAMICGWPSNSRGLNEVTHVAIHWQRTEPDRRQPRTRKDINIVTLLDAQGRPHGTEVFRRWWSSTEARVHFDHGRVAWVDIKYPDMLVDNVLHTIDNMHAINLAHSCRCSACRSDPYRPNNQCNYYDVTDLATRGRARFLMACAYEGMRELPWELRRHIFGFVFPERIASRRWCPPWRWQRSRLASHV
jgi:hypothetical protein